MKAFHTDASIRRHDSKEGALNESCQLLAHSKGFVTRAMPTTLSGKKILFLIQVIHIVVPKYTR